MVVKKTDKSRQGLLKYALEALSMLLAPFPPEEIY